MAQRFASVGDVLLPARGYRVPRPGRGCCRGAAVWALGDRWAMLPPSAAPAAAVVVLSPALMVKNWARTASGAWLCLVVNKAPMNGPRNTPERANSAAVGTSDDVVGRGETRAAPTPIKGERHRTCGVSGSGRAPGPPQRAEQPTDGERGQQPAGGAGRPWAVARTAATKARAPEPSWPRLLATVTVRSTRSARMARVPHVSAGVVGLPTVAGRAEGARQPTQVLRRRRPQRSRRLPGPTPDAGEGVGNGGTSDTGHVVGQRVCAKRSGQPVRASARA
jgi:hypothetical protein